MAPLHGDRVGNDPGQRGLATLAHHARLAGLLDWDAIEDRIRRPVCPPEFADLDELVDAAVRSYRLPRWAGQKRYVELWGEKDALAGVLAPIAAEYHVTLMVNRGYSSQSAMHEAALRFIGVQQAAWDRQRPAPECVILYLGDHDPSGEDMVRDVQDRLTMFTAEVEVVKLALTMAQVRQYQPPPNPAKITDPRAAAYIERFGEHSWEVDALPPDVLARMIRGALRRLVDRAMMDAVIAREDADKARLRAALLSPGPGTTEEA